MGEQPGEAYRAGRRGFAGGGKEARQPDSLTEMGRLHRELPG